MRCLGAFLVEPGDFGSAPSAIGTASRPEQPFGREVTVETEAILGEEGMPFQLPRENVGIFLGPRQEGSGSAWAMWMSMEPEFLACG